MTEVIVTKTVRDWASGRHYTAEEARLLANAYHRHARDVIGYIRICRDQGLPIGRFLFSDLILARLECSALRRLTRDRLASRYIEAEPDSELVAKRALHWGSAISDEVGHTFVICDSCFRVSYHRFRRTERLERNIYRGDSDEPCYICQSTSAT